MEKIKQHIARSIYRTWGKISPKGLVAYLHKAAYRKRINWTHPTTIDEKIQWLQFNSDTRRWSQLADKYAIRDYVAQKGFADKLVPLIGVWKKAKDIDWEQLPNWFVMKVNHGSGDALICKDKSLINPKIQTRLLARLLRKKFGYQWGEPHYNRISPCILAEELLDSNHQSIASSSLIDYKIWCFDGKAAYIWVCYNRTSRSCQVGVYDLDWNFHPEYSVSTPHYQLMEHPIPCPTGLEEMLRMACALSEGFPEVRIDCYETEGKVYFGEMTFTAASGLNTFYTEEFRTILGKLCHLPQEACRK